MSIYRIGNIIFFIFSMKESRRREVGDFFRVIVIVYEDLDGCVLGIVFILFV